MSTMIRDQKSVLDATIVECPGRDGIDGAQNGEYTRHQVDCSCMCLHCMQARVSSQQTGSVCSQMLSNDRRRLRWRARAAISQL